LIHAGDFSTEGRPGDTIDFLKWFGSLKGYQAKVFIAGNHDVMPWQKRGLFDEWLFMYANDCHYLEDRDINVCGLTIHGSPRTPLFGETGCFMHPRGGDVIQMFRDRIPTNIDVLVTHGPPQGYLDLSNNWNEATGKKWEDHLGCEQLREALWRVHPLLHVFGHIHGSGGKTEKVIDDGHEMILVNASIMDEAYIPNHKAVIINLP
jgi:Icc-related predicted phosphoesterase